MKDIDVEKEHIIPNPGYRSVRESESAKLVWYEEREGSQFQHAKHKNMCTLTSAASKLAQLWCLWQTKDSGQASVDLEYVCIYLARIFTAVMTMNDLIVLFHFITMLILNVWVTATTLHYRKTKKD